MAENMRVLRPGQIYRHFKGNLYQIVTVALHSETGEQLVIYQKLYDNYNVHARPLDMFMSEVDRRKYPRARQKYRFELVHEPAFRMNTDLEVSDRAPLKAAMQAERNQTAMSVNSILQNSKNTNEMNRSKPENINIQSSDASENQEANPYLLQFLDADTYEEKKDVLIKIKKHMTDRLIDDIAAAMDVTVDEGDLEIRYNSLMNCVDTRKKFECNRFR